MTYLPIIILLGVVVLTAVRRVGGFRLQIWQIMLAGAMLVLITGGITPAAALRSINPDVMLFLFGMFVVGEALVESGYLYHISFSLFKRARTSDELILSILFVLGFFSAFLMNDTVAIIGTPLVLFHAEKHNISSKLLLLSLCFATTIGSVASPIGNPQNLLIAMGGKMNDPFVSFFKYLAVPTVINIFLAYLVLKLIYGKDFHKVPLDNSRDRIKDRGLAALSRASLAFIFALVIIKIFSAFFLRGFDFKLTYIALLAALPILVLSPKRVRIIRNMDWHTLVFFASLFVMMAGVWSSGLIQSFISSFNMDLASINLILIVSVLLSQLLSNVPFVALYLPMLNHLDTPAKGMAALAAGSTIAGNLLILGAASNIIIIQNAEKKGETLTFSEFAKAGVPLTVLNIFVYWLFLTCF